MNFDKRTVYEDTIKNKVLELVQLCNREKMPVFVCVCVQNDENGTKYEKEMFSGSANDIVLTDDKIADYVNVSNGFQTILPSNVIEVEYE